MMERLDIEVPRNGDYFGEWRLTDDAGEPIDLTGHALSMIARATGGDPVIVASATIAITEAANGQFTVRWHGADFDQYGDPFARSDAAYDLKQVYPDGIILIPVRGQLYITPEVTF